MNTQTTNSNEEWLKVLSKGLITIPKAWRDELGIMEGTVVKARKEGKKVVFESIRTFTDEEIDQWLKDDILPRELKKKLDRKFGSID